MKTARFLIFILVVASLPSNIFGQTATTGRVSGVVTDAQGAVVAGATVKLMNKATKAEKTDVTDSEGRYGFAAVPGTYEVSVAAQGFRTTVVSDLKADITKVSTLDVELQPGGSEEQVTVTATGEVQLQKDDSSVGNVIDADRIKKLPQINRQVTSLLLGQPAVAPGGEVAGARADQNTFTLDGLDVSDQVGFRGAVATVVPVPSESVEEFRVTVANPNATFGRSAGGQVALVTKRGGNAFHGSVYEYHRNDNFIANSWRNNRLGIEKPELIDNRFGFSVGGPIWKEKTFFFGNYEGRRLPGTLSVTRIVPTQSYRDGQLRFRDASGNVNTFNPRTFDPRGLGANPQIQAYHKTLPLPNNFTVGDGLNTGGFTADLPTNLRDDFGVLRLDHQINSNWSVEARGSLYRNIQALAGQADIVNLVGGGAITERPKNLVFAVTGTIRPNLVNELRIGHAFDNFDLIVIDPSTIAKFNVAVNVGGGQLDEAIDVDAQRARRQALGGGTTQYTDNATWSKGAHTFQFGGTLRSVSTLHTRNDKVIGSLSTPVAEIGDLGSNVRIGDAERPLPCSPTVTSNCLQAADVSRYDNLYASLLGIVDTVSFLAVRDANLKPLPPGTVLENNAKLRAWEFYFADVWRVKPSLTLSYGLTYQWNTPPKDKFDRQTVLAFKDTGNLIDPQDYLRQKAAAAENGDIFNPDIAYIPVKELGGRGVFKINRKDFSPRFSVAWQPSFTDGLFGRVFGERRTVIRGGYSLLYDRLNTVSSVVVPMLGVGFAQTLNFQAPRNAAGQPFRAGIDGPIPVPVNTAQTSPVVPGKPFGELLSFTMDPNIKDPYNHAVDFTIQRELPGKMLIEVGYIGRFARNLYQNVELNSAPIFHKDKASGQRFAEAFDAVAGALRTGGVVRPQAWFENQLFPGATGVLASFFSAQFVDGDVSTLWQQGIDLLPLFGLPVQKGPFNNTQSLILFVRTSLGRSNYNGMFVTLHKRTSHGLTFDVNYTLSRSLDQLGLIQNFIGQFTSSFEPDIDYSPSDFDRTHILNSNFVYELPFGRGRRYDAGNRLDKIIGGWYVSGIYTASSGVPQTVFQGFGGVFGGGNFTQTGAIPRTRPNFGNSVHRRVAGSPTVGTTGNPAEGGSGLNVFSNPEQAFNSFRHANIATDGRSGRGVLRGFSRWNLDMSLGKETKIGERVKFAISADFFNIFNRVQFVNPLLDFTDKATFGVVDNAFGSRQIQFGARIEF
ncbi:MAG: carboxypeptidase regulatory-like domain-containing protein [Acidobacteriota bacterium]